MHVRTAVADDLPLLRALFRRSSLSNADDAAAQRRGIGALLVADAVTLARRDGALRLEVTGNPHASRFYSAVGFDAVGEVATELGPGIRMHLDLSPAA